MTPAESEPVPGALAAVAAVSDPRQRWLAALVLVLSVWAAYFVALDGDFLFDDLVFTYDNAAVKGPFSLARIFSSPYWAGEGYRPLAVLTFALDYRLYRLHTFGFHVTNVLIHSVNVLLLLALLTRLLGDARTAFLGALIFAVLPVHAEVVANIAQRDAALAMLFFLLGWLAWLRGGKAGLGMALLAYLLGLLSKEEAATLPGALLLGDYLLGRLPDRRAWFQACVRCSAFCIPLTVYALLRWNAIGNLGAAVHVYFSGCSWLTVALTMARFSVEHYLPGLLAGANLSCSHARPSFADASPADPVAWLDAALLLGGAFGAATWFVRRRSPAAFGAVFGLLTLLPASNLIVRIWAIGAQRYLYLPSLGYCVAIAVAVRRLDRRTRAAPVVALLVVAGYFAATVVEAGAWRSGLRLYTQMLERTPDNPAALHGLAYMQREQGEMKSAWDLSGRALRLDADWRKVESSMAEILAPVNRPEEGLERLHDAEGKFGRFDDFPWITLVPPLLKLGRTADARECARHAFELAPDSSQAWLCLGDVSLAEGKQREAEDQFRRCLELDPDNVDGAQRLAALLRLRNDLAGSRDVLAAVLEGVPDFATGWDDLGITLDQLQDLRGAEEAYCHAIELRPDWGIPCQNFGILLLKLGRLDEAGDLFENALARIPTLIEAKVSLGIVRARQGRGAEAAAVWKEFLQAAGNDPRYASAAGFVREQLAAIEAKK